MHSGALVGSRRPLTRFCALTQGWIALAHSGALAELGGCVGAQKCADAGLDRASALSAPAQIVGCAGAQKCAGGRLDRAGAPSNYLFFSMKPVGSIRERGRGRKPKGVYYLVIKVLPRSGFLSHWSVSGPGATRRPRTTQEIRLCGFYTLCGT